MKRCNRFLNTTSNPYIEFNFEKSLRKYEKTPHKRIKTEHSRPSTHAVPTATHPTHPRINSPISCNESKEKTDNEVLAEQRSVVNKLLDMKEEVMIEVSKQ